MVNLPNDFLQNVEAIDDLTATNPFVAEKKCRSLQAEVMKIPFGNNAYANTQRFIMLDILRHLLTRIKLAQAGSSGP